MRSVRRRAGLLVLVALFIPYIAQADPDGGVIPGPATLYHVLAGFAAKEGCSCVFGDGQTDDYCSAFAQAPPLQATLAIDHTAMIVKATALTTVRTAHAVPGAGCVLDIP